MSSLNLVDWDARVALNDLYGALVLPSSNLLDLLPVEIAVFGKVLLALPSFFIVG